MSFHVDGERELTLRLAACRVVEPDGLSSSGSRTGRKESVLCEDGEMGVEPCADARPCRSALYGEMLGEVAYDAPVFDYRGGESFEGPKYTLVVFLYFRDAAKREACWSVLQRTLEVPAEAWLDGESESGCEGRSLLLWLRFGNTLGGCYSAAELDHRVEHLLGCPCSPDGGMNPTLQEAERISFQLIADEMLYSWTVKHEVWLDDCTHVSIAIGEQEAE